MRPKAVFAELGDETALTDFVAAGAFVVAGGLAGALGFVGVGVVGDGVVGVGVVVVGVVVVGVVATAGKLQDFEPVTGST